MSRSALDTFHPIDTAFLPIDQAETFDASLFLKAACFPNALSPDDECPYWKQELRGFTKQEVERKLRSFPPSCLRDNIVIHGIPQLLSPTATIPIDSTQSYSSSSWSSNAPCEDGTMIFTSSRIEASCYVVIDGHGGTRALQMIQDLFPWLVAERIERLLESTPTETSGPRRLTTEEAQGILYGSIMEMEAMLLASSLGKSLVKSSGACLACALVLPDQVVCANVGDCRIIRVEKAESVVALPVTRDHLPTDPTEAKRIHVATRGIDRFPLRPSVVALQSLMESTSPYKENSLQEIYDAIETIYATVDSSDFGSYRESLIPMASLLQIPIDRLSTFVPRVEGNHMISRALGNAYVKDPLCSITNLYKACEALIAKPTLYSFPIDPTVDTAIVLVSDGITNHLDMNDMARAVESWHPKQPRNLAQTIVVAAGERAASKSGLTFRQLHSLAKGRERRSVWDDATCIAVHLFPNHVSLAVAQ